MLEDFFKVLESYSIKPSRKVQDLLELYAGRIVRFNDVVHLTSKRDTKNAIMRNLFDSIMLDIFLPKIDALVDLGAGAGFVGVVMKILRPELTVFFVERNKRKSSFLSVVSKELGLDRVQVLCDSWANMNMSCDVAVSKASCGIEELVRIMPNLVKVGGMLVHYSSTLEQFLNPDDFFRYYSPYCNTFQYLLVFRNKASEGH
ncbi:MAG TPA: class I SAM-dependent methyltransferase [Candidatus Hydrothermia bacterium]|nr:class I SAM-dependent methyltransferase [Candidatus Hydrothermae bacterium]MDD3649782.1 class I SAM-dependent methyltransferase [Candidatus Hydrothermia bacterium]HOK23687.1 class I SAM-dependent methyltransferase [Candidatus Hydrothermia bacterium]HOL24396.1 class I SAM-dependent methyltransferase [Candidatus Hydrothermia bacterium]HPO79398.1 class I SAM-dependent methyltransferase [Candidatus Hydrothermia bacterium]